MLLRTFYRYRPIILAAFLIMQGNCVYAEEPQSLPLTNPFLPSTPSSLADISLTQPTQLVQPVASKSNAAVPMTFEQYKVNYLPAAELQKSLQGMCTSGKLMADPLSNSLLLLGTAKEQEFLQQALATLDQPTSQVTLEAKVLSVTNDASKELGINWSWDIIPQVDTNTTSTTSTDDTTSTRNANHGNFRFFHDYSFKFGATLNALIAKGKAKILASPHIITLAGKEGKIFIGDHIPYQIEKCTTNYTYTATEYIDAGITLRYTPIFDQAENMITAEVHTEVSTPTLVAELKNYKVTQRKVDTTVRMKSGETLVIGGLITDEEQRTLQKIPFLGDLPLLGALFRNRTTSHTTKEIILLLTPYITAAGSSPAIYTQRAQSISQTKIDTPKLE